MARMAVEPSGLMAAAPGLAERAARVARLAAREMKRLVAAAGESPLENGLDREHEALFGLFRTRDAREGIAAFVEKREARLEGR
ncbi:MAG TPA: hypothetical protein VIV12_05920 [Streptosporangiaceae bacterium]